RFAAGERCWHRIGNYRNPDVHCSRRDRRPRQEANRRSRTIGENWVYSPAVIRDEAPMSRDRGERTVPNGESTTLPRSRSHASRADQTSADAVAMLTSQPRFPEALRATAATFVELYQGNRLLNTLLNDRGRLVVSYFALV